MLPTCFAQECCLPVCNDVSSVLCVESAWQDPGTPKAQPFMAPAQIASPLCGFSCGSCTQSIPSVLRSCHCFPLFLCCPLHRASRVVLCELCSAGSHDWCTQTSPPCRALRAAHLLHPASSLCILETPHVLLCPGHFSRPLNTWQLILLGAFPFLRLQLATITEHPHGSATGMSGAPLQPRFRCHSPGDLGRKIHPACRKDQELLSPDTAIRKHCIHRRNLQQRRCAGALPAQTGVPAQPGAPDSIG